MALMFRPLRERNYRLWAAADIVSVSGTWMQVLALNWLVLEVTGSAAAMGFSVLIQAAPNLILGGWGGALADRLPARPVLVATQCLRALLSLALAGAVLLHVDSLWPVYAVIALSGVIGPLEGPVLGRFGSTLIPRDALGAALALGSVVNSGARIVGMALGGVVVGMAGPAPLFLFNAVSFVAVVVAVLAIRMRDTYPLATAAAGSGDAGVRAGLRYLLSQPTIMIILGLSFLLGSLGRNYQLTMAAMSSGPLGSGAGGYGALSTVFAVGAVLGGLLAAARGRMSMRLLLISGAGISVLELAAGLAPGLLTFAMAILPIAAGAVIVDTVVSARVQLDTREEMRGRMVAALGLVSSLSGMAGAPLLGWMCDTIGPRGALATAGVVTTAGCVVAGVLLARLRGAPALGSLRGLLPARLVPASAG